MEPLEFRICRFTSIPTLNLNFYYRTSSTRNISNQVLPIYYRVNGGTWITLNTTSSVGPSAYVLAGTINVNLYDVVEYYFSQIQGTPYGYGNGGLYVGGVASSITISSLTNPVYFNICSTRTSYCATF